MTRTTRLVLILILSVFLPADLLAADVYVAPGGDDSAPGTMERPFKSPARARDAVRELKKAGPVTVHLRGGTYFFSEPLVLTPQDSGTAQAPITYAAHENEKPVLSGGRAVTGWAKQQLNGRDVWAAKLP